MGEARLVRSELALELSRRDFMRNASVLGLGALVMSALPVAELMAPDTALADVGLDEATMQAFADTIIPGRKAAKTDLGDEIHPLAIAGVDPEPGAVEADVMRLYHHPLTGFDALQAPFLADLNTRSLSQQGAPFLSLSFDKRVAVLEPALAYTNSERVLFEAAAAVPFTAFCAAAVHPVGTDRNASGYRVMGYPGAAPNGYQRTFSYRRRLARERTKKGYLP
jgi:hypothetical protein